MKWVGQGHCTDPWCSWHHPLRAGFRIAFLFGLASILAFYAFLWITS